MNEIKEDLNIVELEGLEFIKYSFIILKKNFLNFLPLIIGMIFLNIFGKYRGDAAYFFSKSNYGMKVYKIFASLKIGWLIDKGNGELWVKLGLFRGFYSFAEFIYLFMNSILYFGIIISICKYIDQNIKTNPLLEIRKSVSRILKFIVLEFLAVLAIKEVLGKNIFINMIIYVFLAVIIMKSIFFAQEYFYQKNSIIVSIKNSFYYFSLKLELAGIMLACLSFGMIEITVNLPEMMSVLLSIFFILMTAVLTTLSYFNTKYLIDNEIQDMTASE